MEGPRGIISCKQTYRIKYSKKRSTESGEAVTVEIACTYIYTGPGAVVHRAKHTNFRVCLSEKTTYEGGQFRDKNPYPRGRYQSLCQGVVSVAAAAAVAAAAQSKQLFRQQRRVFMPTMKPTISLDFSVSNTKVAQSQANPKVMHHTTTKKVVGVRSQSCGPGEHYAAPTATPTLLCTFRAQLPHLFVRSLTREMC